MVAEGLVVGDGDVDASVAVEVGRDTAGRRVRAQPREVAGAESGLPVAPVDERVDVPVDGALVAAAQQIEDPVAVEVGDRQAVAAVGRELRLSVCAQPVRPVPEDVVERVVRLAGVGLAAAEQQVGIAVAGDVVRRRVAGAERGRQHERSLGAEPVRAAAQDHAAVAPGRRDRQVKPARPVEIRQHHAAGRDVVSRPLEHGQDRRVLEVEAAAPAVVDRDRRVVEVGDEQVKVAVAVQVGDCAGPAQPGRDDHVGLGSEPGRAAEVDEGAGIQVDGVLVAVDQDDVGPAVVIDVAGEGSGGPRAPQLRTPVGGEAVPSAVVEVAVHRHVRAPA